MASQRATKRALPQTVRCRYIRRGGAHRTMITNPPHNPTRLDRLLDAGATVSGRCQRRKRGGSEAGRRKGFRTGRGGRCRYQNRTQRSTDDWIVVWHLQVGDGGSHLVLTDRSHTFILEPPP